MFEVSGIPILRNELDVLYELREQVFVRTGRRILSKIKPSGNNIMICCPVHSDGQERNPSCGVSLVKVKDKPIGTVHCFACGYVDSLEGMVSRCFGYEGDTFGRTWLLQNFVTGDKDSRPGIPLNFTRDEVIRTEKPYITEEELSRYRFYHPYMYKRGLTNEIIEKYDIGYQKDYIHEPGWAPTEVITFPVRDEQGNCLFVSRRSIYGKTFFLPKDMDKYIYGLYELDPTCSEIVICESVFNALTCVKYGRPAIALFGTGSSNQYEILKKLPVRKFILGLDPDKSGDIGSYKLKKALRGYMLTKLMVPEGKDINDLTEDEFLNLPELLY